MVAEFSRAAREGRARCNDDLLKGLTRVVYPAYAKGRRKARMMGGEDESVIRNDSLEVDSSCAGEGVVKRATLFLFTFDKSGAEPLKLNSARLREIEGPTPDARRQTRPPRYPTLCNRSTSQFSPF